MSKKYEPFLVFQRQKKDRERRGMRPSPRWTNPTVKHILQTYLNERLSTEFSSKHELPIAHYIAWEIFGFNFHTAVDEAISRLDTTTLTKGQGNVQ